MFRILDIMVRIRILGSVTSRFMFVTYSRYIYIILHGQKVIKKSQNSRNQVFSYYFCLMMEGSGSESGRPKNLRIRDTDVSFTTHKEPNRHRVLYLLHGTLYPMHTDCFATCNFIRVSFENYPQAPFHRHRSATAGGIFFHEKTRLANILYIPGSGMFSLKPNQALFSPFS